MTTQQFHNVLVNGCSFSRGPGSWPYHLYCVDQTGLVNLALAGAGNTYIHESTMAAVADNKYDLVIVMWSAPGRCDFQTVHHVEFPEAQTSRYQSLRNDWPEKITAGFDDQDRVEKNWVFTGDYAGTVGPMAPVMKFVNTWCDVNFLARQTLIKMLSLQSYLKQCKIPYVFSLFVNYSRDLRRHHNLWQQLDQRYLVDVYISDVARSLSSYDSDGIHPGPEAHRVWAQQLDLFIIKENLHHA